MLTINSFKWEYEFLSNFFIEPDGTCVEVEYQASKCANPKDAEKFFALYESMKAHPEKIGAKAKSMGKPGKLKNIKPEWADEAYRIDVMQKLVYQKFVDSQELMIMLIETYPMNIIEGNTWRDTFWGVCGGVGHNHLGKIHMTNRDKFLTAIEQSAMMG